MYPVNKVDKDVEVRGMEGKYNKYQESMGFLSKLWNNMKGDDFNWQNVIETNKDKIEKEAERGYNFDFD